MEEIKLKFITAGYETGSTEDFLEEQVLKWQMEESRIKRNIIKADIAISAKGTACILLINYTEIPRSSDEITELIQKGKEYISKNPKATTLELYRLGIPADLFKKLG